MLLTASGDKTLIFWACANATNTYSMTMSWTLPASYVALRYAGGHTLFAADTNHVITQWHLERSEQRCVYRGHTDVVMDLVVLHHYNLLASCSLDTTVRLWDIGKGVEVSIMKGHTKPATVLAYHPDLRLLISAGLDRFALVWNPRVLAPVYTIQCASPLAHIVGLEVLGGSPELVIGDSKGSFMVYDLRSFSVIQQFSVPNLTAEQHLSLHSFTVVHSAGLLIAASAKLHQFKRTTGVRRHHADDNAVRFAAFNATRLTFITVAADNIKVWNALTGMLEREEKNFTAASAITSVCVDDKQRRIYVGCTDGSVYCLNYSSGAIMCRLPVHRTEVSAMAYDAANKSLLSGSWDASVCLSDDKLTAVAKRIHSHTEDVLHLTTSDAFRLAASAAADLSVSLHDLHLGPPLIRWHLEHLPSALLFLDPYPLLLVADHSGGLSVFDTTTPYRRTALAYVAAFSRVPMGEGMAVGGCLRTGREGRSLGDEWEVGEGRAGSRCSVVNAMCFVSRTGVLYTGDDAGYVKGWRLENGLLSVFQERRGKKAAATPRTPQKPSTAQSAGGRQAEEKQQSSEPSPPRSVSMMEGSRASSREQVKTDHRRSILKTAASASVREETVKQVQVISPPTVQRGLRSAAVHSSSEDEASDGDEEDEEEDVDGHPVVHAEDCKRLTSAVAASLLSTLSPHLIVRAHEDSCSGVSYIGLSLPHPALLSFSFDGSVVLSSAATGEHLGALMQGHNSRSDEREGGREWRFEYDLLWHRMKELDLMREGLKAGRGRHGAAAAAAGAPDWLREAGEEDDEERADEDDDAALTVTDRRMMTPARLKRAQEKENQAKERAAIALTGDGHSGPKHSPLPPPTWHSAQQLLPMSASQTLPATASRPPLEQSSVELHESQSAVVDRRLEHVIKGMGAGGNEAQQLDDGRKVAGKVGLELAAQWGRWDIEETSVAVNTHGEDDDEEGSG